MTLQGVSAATSATQRNIIGTPLPQTIRLANDYGVEGQSGGNVQIKRGHISASAYTQSYDLTIAYDASCGAGTSYGANCCADVLSAINSWLVS